MFFYWEHDIYQRRWWSDLDSTCSKALASLGCGFPAWERHEFGWLTREALRKCAQSVRNFPKISAFPYFLCFSQRAVGSSGDSGMMLLFRAVKKSKRGWGGKWDGVSKGRYVYICGWLMLRFDRKTTKVCKVIIFQLKERANEGEF